MHKIAVRSFFAGHCVLGVLVIALFYVAYIGFFNPKLEPDFCSEPKVTSNFIEVNRLQNERYKLFMFVGDYGRGCSLCFQQPIKSKVPILFIHGNKGDYTQVRTLGHHILNSSRNLDSKPDVYSVDLMEEFSAFHPDILLRQASYVVDIINHLSKAYNSPVLILGHSMGGVVARLASMQESYKKDSVNTIITFATPHLASPFPLSVEMQKLYKKMNDFWKLNPPKTAVFSLSPGTLDTQVSSTLTSFKTNLPADTFTLYTASVKDAETGCDHLNVIWCNQLTRQVSESIINLYIENQWEPTKIIISLKNSLMDSYDFVSKPEPKLFHGAWNLTEKISHVYWPERAWWAVYSVQMSCEKSDAKISAKLRNTKTGQGRFLKKFSCLGAKVYVHLPSGTSKDWDDLALELESEPLLLNFKIEFEVWPSITKVARDHILEGLFCVPFFWFCLLCFQITLSKNESISEAHIQMVSNFPFFSIGVFLLSLLPAHIWYEATKIAPEMTPRVPWFASLVPYSFQTFPAACVIIMLSGCVFSIYIAFCNITSKLF